MPTGNLWIRTNPTAPPLNPISTDPEDILSARGEWNRIDYVHVDHCNPNAVENEWYTIKDVPISDAMRKVTKVYPWIAHSIAYYVSMTTPSFALGVSDAELFVKFYPFQRSFFHRAESSLDSLLFAELKKQGRLKAVERLAVNSTDYEKKKKQILGKDYEDPKKNQDKPGGGPGQDKSGTATVPIRPKGGDTGKRRPLYPESTPSGVYRTPQGGGGGGGELEQEDDEDDGNVDYMDDPLPGKKTVGDRARAAEEDYSAKNREREGSLEEEKDDGSHGRGTSQMPSQDHTFFNPGLQQYYDQLRYEQEYQHQLAAQQQQSRGGTYEYIMKGRQQFEEHKRKQREEEERKRKAKLNASQIKVEEEQQKLQLHPTGLDLLGRQFGRQTQGGYFDNGTMVGVLGMGTNQHFADMSTRHNLLVGTFKQGRQDLIQGSRQGKEVVPSFSHRNALDELFGRR